MPATKGSRARRPDKRGRAHVAQGDQKCGEGNNAFETNACAVLEMACISPCKIADLGGRQRDQHADGANDVAERHGDPANEQRPGMARRGILDLASHQRSGFAASEGIDQHRPENDVVEWCWESWSAP